MNGVWAWDQAWRVCPQARKTAALPSLPAFTFAFTGHFGAAKLHCQHLLSTRDGPNFGGITYIPSSSPFVFPSWSESAWQRAFVHLKPAPLKAKPNGFLFPPPIWLRWPTPCQIVLGLQGWGILWPLGILSWYEEKALACKINAARASNTTASNFDMFSVNFAILPPTFNISECKQKYFPLRCSGRGQVLQVKQRAEDVDCSCYIVLIQKQSGADCLNRCPQALKPRRDKQTGLFISTHSVRSI